MRAEILVFSLIITTFAFGQGPGSNPTGSTNSGALLNTGVPNPYPSGPPPLLTGATNTDPSLGASSAAGAPGTRGELPPVRHHIPARPGRQLVYLPAF